MAELRTAEQVVVKEVMEPRFILTLTEAEATALLMVLQRVGGSPTQTRRGDTESVHRVLVEAVTLPDDYHSSYGETYITGAVNFSR